MSRKKKITVIVLSALAAFLLVSVLLILHGNAAIELNTYILEYENLPQGFDGFRIAHVSDLHNAEMGKDNKRLINVLRDAEPDMIAITGDLIDYKKTDVDIALDFAEQAMKIAPCYFVTGNHEARSDKYEELKNGLVSLGVVVLEDGFSEIEIDGEKITVMGIDDFMCDKAYERLYPDQIADKKLKKAEEGVTGFKLLLSHRAYVFDTYAEHGVDLVLSGHAHGGQIRLPFLGGMYVPGQGFFPDYTEGIYTKNNTTMIVSRGIGNSSFPFRINNDPEVILIELKTK